MQQLTKAHNPTPSEALRSVQRAYKGQSIATINKPLSEALRGSQGNATLLAERCCGSVGRSPGEVALSDHGDAQTLTTGLVRYLRAQLPGGSGGVEARWERSTAQNTARIYATMCGNCRVLCRREGLAPAV